MRRKKSSVVVVMAAYNEEKTVNKIVRSLSKYVDKIIVVDDGSVDKTAKLARHPKSVVIRHLMNLGQGAALQTGFEYAKLIKADVIITYDADGQFNPTDVRKFINPIISEKYDVVLGSRFLGKTINIPLSRYIILKIGIIFTYFFSNISLTDTHNGFRAFNIRAIRLIELHHNRSAHASEIIDQISKYKLRFKEVPITVRYTLYSKSKGQKNTNALQIIIELITGAIANL